MPIPHDVVCSPRPTCHVRAKPRGGSRGRRPTCHVRAKPRGWSRGGARWVVTRPVGLAEKSRLRAGACAAGVGVGARACLRVFLGFDHRYDARRR
eukprot:2414625-Prymnesium_polylepis.1